MDQAFSEATMERLLVLTADPNFQPHVMAQKAKAAAGLCTWVINVVAYVKIAEKLKAYGVDARTLKAPAPEPVPAKLEQSAKPAAGEAPVFVDWSPDVDALQQALKDAQDGLNCICKADIGEVKAMAKAPH